MRVDQLPNSISEMPRYFFHLKRGQVTILDQEGLALADIEEAAAEAERRGREIAARDALQGVASHGAVIPSSLMINGGRSSKCQSRTMRHRIEVAPHLKDRCTSRLDHRGRWGGIFDYSLR